MYHWVERQSKKDFQEASNFCVNSGLGGLARYETEEEIDSVNRLIKALSMHFLLNSNGILLKTFKPVLYMLHYSKGSMPFSEGDNKRITPLPNGDGHLQFNILLLIVLKTKPKFFLSMFFCRDE